MNLLHNRKNSQQFSSQSQEDISNLFPKTNLQDLNNAIADLKQHYNKSLHSFELTNYCYRCHIKEITHAYNQFKDKHHPQLLPPKISNLYENQAFVDLIELSKKNIGPNFEVNSLYIPPVPKNLNEILTKTFTKYGYIPNYQRFLLFFPTYLQKHMVVQDQLFESDKIDSLIAYFLAILGAAQLGSVYVMARMLKRFLKAGGEMQWILQGKYPQKYKLISNLNRYMARAPWQINPEMIQEILENTNFHWNKSELAICIQILAFSHSMSTIALGLGLLAEQQSILTILNLQKIQQIKDKLDSTVYESSAQSKQSLACMIPVLKQIQQQLGDRASQFKEEMINNNKKIMKKSMRKSQAIDNYMKEIGNQLTKQQIYRDINKLLTPLLPQFQLFQKRGEMKNNIIDYSEFNYKFMAYPILHNYTQSIADKIEGFIEYSEIMTRGNFGNERVNHTKEFRKAVRYYSQNLCGYTHHQYDFKNNVASILPMSLKFYIRLLTLSPFHITKQVIRQTNHESGQIECFDLGHLAILIANAKMSLEMTLAIQAFQL